MMQASCSCSFCVRQTLITDIQRTSPGKSGTPVWILRVSAASNRDTHSAMMQPSDHISIAM